MSQVTKKTAVTVNIVEREQELGGKEVLVNPADGSEIETAILNAEANGNVSR